MKKRFSLLKEKSSEIIRKLTKIQKTSLAIALLVVIGGVTVLVYADEGHDTPEPVVQQTEQVIVRKVGDVDADAISQEGLSSFYGEIVSKDVASINPSRDGVISSWEVSVGDSVSAGEVLGYVTVTGVGAEQQQQLAQQQANALKAQLDLETANKIADQTTTVFGKIGESLKSVADKQRALYDGANGTVSTTYQTELQAITSKQTLFANKLQDFGKTALAEIYPKLSTFGNYPLSVSTFTPSFRYGVGTLNSSLQFSYAQFLQSYGNKVYKRTLTEDDVRLFLDKTTEFVSASLPTDSFTDADAKAVIENIGALQTDFRDLSGQLTQATIDKASKERERSQIDVELSKSLAGFDNDLSLKKLEQLSANERAKNEAKGAELLAQKLATNAGGVIPILATKSGVVATIEKNVGDYVTISDRIGFISNANPRKNVRFTIPASWKDISKGDTLSISWRPEYSMGSAVITGISPIIDEKGGYQAEAVISKDTVFPVGASVRIIPENSKKGVFVNRKAVVFEGVTPFVWIVTESNVVRKQEVKVGRSLGEYVEILAGLDRGFSYLIILDSQVVLENGKSINEILKTNTAVETTTPKPIQNESVPHSHDE